MGRGYAFFLDRWFLFIMKTWCRPWSINTIPLLMLFFAIPFLVYFYFLYNLFYQCHLINFNLEILIILLLLTLVLLIWRNRYANFLDFVLIILKRLKYKIFPKIKFFRLIKGIINLFFFELNRNFTRNIIKRMNIALVGHFSWIEKYKFFIIECFY